MNDETVIRLWMQAKSGDRGALAELLRCCQDQVYRFCLSQLGDSNLAVDATQETASRLMQRLESFNPETRFSTWVLGFALNVCRETRRKQYRESQIEESNVRAQVTDGETPDQALQSKESSSRVRKAIDGLPDRQRQAIVLRFFESLSLADIANVMQIETGTVKATINKALQNLRKQL